MHSKYTFTVDSIPTMQSDNVTWLWWVLPVVHNGVEEVALISNYWISNIPVLTKDIRTV